MDRSQPNNEMQAFVQRILGYTLIGASARDEQAFFTFVGRGGDGKSTTMTACAHVLGTYATSAPVAMFLEGGALDKGGESATPQLMTLVGDVRLVTTSEPPRGSKLADGAIKMLTGGGKMKPRGLQQSPIETTPQFRLFIESNWRFETPPDKGFWRRFIVVEWNHPLAEDERDPSFMRSLREDEGEGILLWMIEGALSYLEAGLASPDEARAAASRWRDENDSVGEWLIARVELGPNFTEAQNKLRADYDAFCERNKAKPFGPKRLWETLEHRGILRTGKLHGQERTPMWKGARLLYEGPNETACLAQVRSGEPSRAPVLEGPPPF